MGDLADEDHGLVRLDLKSTQPISDVTVEEVQVDEYYYATVLRREVYRVIHGFSSSGSLLILLDFCGAVGFKTRSSSDTPRVANHGLSIQFTFPRSIQTPTYTNSVISINSSSCPSFRLVLMHGLYV